MLGIRTPIKIENKEDKQRQENAIKFSFQIPKTELILEKNIININPQVLSNDLFERWIKC